MELTRKKLAKRLGISVGTVRKYERLYSDWLETPKGTKGKGVAKVFTEHDALVLSTIAAMRDEDISLDDIRTQLDERLATATLDAATTELVPAEQVTKDEQGEDRSVAMDLFMTQVRALEATEGELAATREERDYLRQRVEDMERRLEEEVARRAKLEGQLDVYKQRPPGFWQRLFGGGDS